MNEYIRSFFISLLGLGDVYSRLEDHKQCILSQQKQINELAEAIIILAKASSEGGRVQYYPKSTVLN